MDSKKSEIIIFDNQVYIKDKERIKYTEDKKIRNKIEVGKKIDKGVPSDDWPIFCHAYPVNRYDLIISKTTIKIVNSTYELLELIFNLLLII